MPRPVAATSTPRLALANKLFFRLYQCANLMHKTGSSALQPHSLTTQQWAVMAALSGPAAAKKMSIGDLTHFLLVSRQNLVGVLGRMQRDGHLSDTRAAKGGRIRRVCLSASGRRVWKTKALPEIHADYKRALHDFSVDDILCTVDRFQMLLDNMKGLSDPRPTRAGEDSRRGSIAAP